MMNFLSQKKNDMENNGINEEKMMEGAASEQCVVEMEQERKPTLEYVRKKVSVNLREVMAIEEKICRYDEWFRCASRVYHLKRELMEADLDRKRSALKRWSEQEMEMEEEAGKEGDA